MLYKTNQFVLLEQMFCDDEWILTKYSEFSKPTIKEWLREKEFIN